MKEKEKKEFDEARAEAEYKKAMEKEKKEFNLEHMVLDETRKEEGRIFIETINKTFAGTIRCVGKDVIIVDVQCIIDNNGKETYDIDKQIMLYKCNIICVSFENAVLKDCILQLLAPIDLLIKKEIT